jgi:hypothetical protein
VQRVLEQIREAEVLQAIDRCRPVFNERRVIVLNDLTLDLTIDEVRPWKELAAGGNRFEQFFSRYGVLPLSAKWLATAAPDLWRSTKAAEHDLGRWENTPKPLKEYTYRSLGVFSQAAFRAVGQRGKPTRALVDPGRVADAEDAIAKAIGQDLAAFEWIDEPPEPPGGKEPSPKLPAPEVLETANAASRAKSTPPVQPTTDLGAGGVPGGAAGPIPPKRPRQRQAETADVAVGRLETTGADPPGE